MYLDVGTVVTITINPCINHSYKIGNIIECNGNRLKIIDIIIGSDKVIQLDTIVEKI